MTEKLSPEIVRLLEEACDNDIKNYTVTFQNEDSSGQGYLGEMIFLTMSNKVTRKSMDYVIKQAIAANTSENVEVMESTYFNEIHFYKTIWPELVKLQESIPGFKCFNKIPKCYAISSEPGKEKLVMENLKSIGCEMIPRDGTFDHHFTTLLMKTYGQFHGISAAYRELNPEEYKKLTDPLKKSTESVLTMEIFKNYISGCMNHWHSLVEDEKIKKKLFPYKKSGLERAIEAINYRGKNPVINHGDCWSNNIMFKINKNGLPEDIRFLDFQLCRSGSVVNDLSYLLYSGVTKEIFFKLDNYLRIYHDSFSRTLRNFNLDPSQIFTFEDLKQEWKEYCAFGFIMGQIIWRGKLSKTYETRSLVEVNGTSEYNPNDNSQNIAEKYQMDTVRMREISLDLAEHLYENDYL